MPVWRILRNSFMSAVLLAAQRAQHRLALGETMAQQLARDTQQLSDEAAAERVIRERAVLARGDQVTRAERGEMLRDDRLVELQRVLDLLQRSHVLRHELQKSG